VTPEIETALDAYLRGDGDNALRTLDKADKISKDSLMKWHLSYIRAQVLIMMGRSA